jgi:hypothetical protein
VLTAILTVTVLHSEGAQKGAQFCWMTMLAMIGGIFLAFR